ncbi:TonB-dependent receptor [Temperatibacter marinus]|uniref:TonB-dependent receptor n=1 Tax=Temperatibacter marinus TaxID=1456591 RepID=A0AA52HBQ2_9PROT|nr:TonB-dependent receptor [Temperatibacter marinus]WND03878.1 TonB-dependent receptor [Temperatibacter marinus]
MKEYSKATLKVALLTTTVMSAPLAAQAQDDEMMLEEIVVTARKTSESMQSVPISIQALGQSKLEDANVGGFSDFTKMLPSVSIASVGPGNAQIYMRGISDGGDGNFSGTNPSVGVYLDDQPVTAIGRVLDVHMYDIARVEALSGPQGTLYGASSQAGTIRIITNEPDPSGFSAGIDMSAGFTRKGEESYSLEGFVNVPVSDTAALRVVGWHVSDGGYIDNVKGAKVFTVDGLNNAGNPATSRIRVTNDDYLEKDFNDEENTGMRAALKVDLNDSWTATAKLMHQKQKTTGVWDHDPEDVGDLKVQRFFEDRGEDKFTQAGLTIEGEVAGMDLVYAGSYLDRDVQYDIDYSEYAAYSSFIPYYTCDFDANYYFLTDTCTDPRIQFDQESKYKVQTHEIRLQSAQDKRLRFIAGLFYQDAEHAYDNQWRIPTLRAGKRADDNFTGNVSGHYSDSYFITDQVRTDTEKAVFGEVTYDINEQLSATVGARFFKSSSKLEGVVATFWWNGELLDLESSESSSIFKFSLDYQVNDDVLLYGTVSEGFRPGGNNRVTGTSAGATYNSDLITNYEFGWKSTLADGRARFNGSIFVMDWSDIQLTRFDPSISLLGLTANVGSAKVKGLETDITVAATESLTLSASMSYIDASLSENYAVDVANIDSNPDAPEGTRLSMIPKFKVHMSARQSFEFMDYSSFFQASLSHQGSSYNDFFINNREKQAGYTIADLSIGIEEDDWSLILFAENLFDERAEMYRNSIDYDSRITTNRPRSFTVRYSKQF